MTVVTGRDVTLLCQDVGCRGVYEHTLWSYCNDRPGFNVQLLCYNKCQPGQNIVSLCCRRSWNRSCWPYLVLPGPNTCYYCWYLKRSRGVTLLCCHVRINTEQTPWNNSNSRTVRQNKWLQECYSSKERGYIERLLSISHTAHVIGISDLFGIQRHSLVDYRINTEDSTPRSKHLDTSK